MKGATAAMVPEPETSSESIDFDRPGTDLVTDPFCGVRAHPGTHSCHAQGTEDTEHIPVGPAKKIRVGLLA
eukprot:scaffold136074_cov19-Tisochrysis_lutea.AAC.2